MEVFIIIKWLSSFLDFAPSFLLYWLPSFLLSLASLFPSLASFASYAFSPGSSAFSHCFIPCSLGLLPFVLPSFLPSFLSSFLYRGFLTWLPFFFPSFSPTFFPLFPWLPFFATFLNIFPNIDPGSESPCHRDPFHNILCQVYGEKTVLLFSPSDEVCIKSIGCVILTCNSVLYSALIFFDVFVFNVKYPLQFNSILL